MPGWPQMHCCRLMTELNLQPCSTWPHKRPSRTCNATTRRSWRCQPGTLWRHRWSDQRVQAWARGGSTVPHSHLHCNTRCEPVRPCWSGPCRSRYPAYATRHTWTSEARDSSAMRIPDRPHIECGDQTTWACSCHCTREYPSRTMTCTCGHSTAAHSQPWRSTSYPTDDDACHVGTR